MFTLYKKINIAGTCLHWRIHFRIWTATHIDLINSVNFLRGFRLFLKASNSLCISRSKLEIGRGETETEIVSQNHVPIISWTQLSVSYSLPTFVDEVSETFYLKYQNTKYLVSLE